MINNNIQKSILSGALFIQMTAMLFKLRTLGHSFILTLKKILIPIVGSQASTATYIKDCPLRYLSFIVLIKKGRTQSSK